MSSDMIPLSVRAIENELVISFRLNNGLCHVCGTRIFEVNFDPHTEMRRITPLTVEGIVKEGRCLYCHPDTSTTVSVSSGTNSNSPVVTESRASRGRRKRNSEDDDLTFITPERDVKIIRLTPEESSVVVDVTSRSSDHGLRHVENQHYQPDCKSGKSSSNTKKSHSKKTRRQKTSPKVSISSRASRQQPRAHKLQDAATSSSFNIPLPKFRKFSVSDEEKVETNAFAEVKADKVLSAGDSLALSNSTTTPKAEKSSKTSAPIVAKDESFLADFDVISDYENAKAELLAETDMTIQEISGVPSQKMIRLLDSDNDVYYGVIVEGTLQKGRAHVKCKENRSKDSVEAGRMSVYKGEFENGLFEGEGYHLDAAGCLYRGQFHQGASHGHGTCTWPSGWMYSGEWKNDLREGYGTSRQILPGGEIYSGYWKNDQWHGDGELRFAGGDVYTGEFFKGNMQGNGQYKFSDGSVYIGAFEQDVRCGHGEMVYADGSIYVGEWKKNWREGRGTLTKNDGTIFEGTFLGDEKVDGRLTLSDGTVHKVKNGHVHK